MMGSGKSAVGRGLAQRLSLPFVDSDREIESRAGCTVSEIFAQKGEPEFRRLEAEVIREISLEPKIVALGGGACAQPGMMEFLLERGTLIYLRADLDILIKRIGDARTRPMLQKMSPKERRERIETLQRERESSYSQAHIMVDTTEGPVTIVVDKVVEQLELRARA
jgi:shikimate kinase